MKRIHNRNAKNCCDNHKAHKPFFWAGYAMRLHAYSIPVHTDCKAGNFLHD